MDLFFGMISMVKDINSTDKQYSNLNFQLKYTIQRAKLLLTKITTDEASIAFMIENLNRRLHQAEGISKKLDDLLNQSSLAMKDKIRLSLPFDRTKNQVTAAIENLQKAIVDLKEEMPEEGKSDGAAGVKRSFDSRNTRNTPASVQVPQTIQEQENERSEQVYEMGPTINDDELIFSQNKANRESAVQFTISVEGSEQIINCLKSECPQVLQTKKRITEADFDAVKGSGSNEITLYTAARINFQKCYAKVKKISNDIDRISTKSHFHFILKKIESAKQNNPVIDLPLKKEQQNQLSFLKTSIGAIKSSSFGHLSASSKKRNSESQKQSQRQSQRQGQRQSQKQGQKQQEEMFFSFPTDEKEHEQFQDFKIIMRKQDNKKIVYRLHVGEWVKVEEDEIEIMNGEKIAAFVNPETKQPTIYFQIIYCFGQ